MERIVFVVTILLWPGKLLIVRLKEYVRRVLAFKTRVLDISEAACRINYHKDLYRLRTSIHLHKTFISSLITIELKEHLENNYHFSISRGSPRDILNPRVCSNSPSPACKVHMKTRQFLLSARKNLEGNNKILFRLLFLHRVSGWPLNVGCPSTLIGRRLAPRHTLSFQDLSYHLDNYQVKEKGTQQHVEQFFELSSHMMTVN